MKAKTPPLSAEELRREREQSRKRKEDEAAPAIERVRIQSARMRRLHGHQPGWFDLKAKETEE